MAKHLVFITDTPEATQAEAYRRESRYASIRTIYCSIQDATEIDAYYLQSCHLLITIDLLVQYGYTGHVINLPHARSLKRGVDRP